MWFLVYHYSYWLVCPSSLCSFIQILFTQSREFLVRSLEPHIYPPFKPLGALHDWKKHNHPLCWGHSAELASLNESLSCNLHDRERDRERENKLGGFAASRCQQIADDGTQTWLYNSHGFTTLTNFTKSLTYFIWTHPLIPIQFNRSFLPTW